MNKRLKPYIYLIFGLLIAGVLSYWLGWRHWVVLAYEQKAPDWFQALIQMVYPRFGVEKQRFSLDFFLNKADQVMYRLALVSIIAFVFFWLMQHRATFRQKINHYWDGTTPQKNIQWQLRWFAALMLLFTWDWYFYLKNLGQAQAFYAPILPYRILHLPFPAQHWLLTFFLLFLLANMAILINFKAFLSSVVSVFFFVLLQGYMYCFHKLDHTYATLTYVALLIPILAWYYEKTIQNNETKAVIWPWRLIQISIALVYFQAGLEKLLIGGLEWFQPQNFRAYLYMHPTQLGDWLSQSDFWCVSLPLGAMMLQLGFISIIFYPKSKWLLIPVGILFHLGTYLLLGIGWYYSPWMLVYVFLIDWTPKKLRIS